MVRSRAGRTLCHWLGGLTARKGWLRPLTGEPSLVRRRQINCLAVYGLGTTLTQKQAYRCDEAQKRRSPSPRALHCSLQRSPPIQPGSSQHRTSSVVSHPCVLASGLSASFPFVLKVAASSRLRPHTCCPAAGTDSQNSTTCGTGTRTPKTTSSGRLVRQGARHGQTAAQWDAWCRRPAPTRMILMAGYLAAAPFPPRQAGRPGLANHARYVHVPPCASHYLLTRPNGGGAAASAIQWPPPGSDAHLTAAPLYPHPPTPAPTHVPHPPVAP